MSALEPAWRRRCRQVAWFIGLWLAGVATVGAVAGLIKYSMLYLK